MVQAVNYLVIIVKIIAKTHNITNRKRLPWCELINPYIIFSLSMCFTIRHEKPLSEMLKLPRLSKVSGVSRSRPASPQLQRLVLVSSWTKFWMSPSHLGLSSEGLVHIPNHLDGYVLLCCKIQHTALPRLGFSTKSGFFVKKLRFLLKFSVATLPEYL